MKGLQIYNKCLNADMIIPARMKRTYFEKLISAPIFILNNDHLSKRTTLETANVDYDKLAIPFKTCYFENVGEPNLFSLESEQGDTIFDVVSMLVDEVAPNVYEVTAPIMDPKTGRGAFFVAMITADFEGTMARSNTFTAGLNKLMDKLTDDMRAKLDMDKFKETQQAMSNAMAINLNMILDKIHKSAYGKEDCYKGVRLKNTPYGNNYQYKPTTVIRIKEHTEATGEIRPLLGNRIQWLSCWWTRGHWRKHNGVGKNRAGEYCVENMTWVSEHIKGDDTMEAKKKAYVV